MGAVRDDAILVSCTKGILNDSLETPNEILKRVLPPALHSRLAYLSGPSFAAEVAKQNPTAVTIASESDAVAKHVQVWGQLAGQCRDGMAAVHPQQRFAQLLTQITAALPLKVPIASLPVLPARSGTQPKTAGPPPLLHTYHPSFVPAGGCGGGRVDLAQRAPPGTEEGHRVSCH